MLSLLLVSLALGQELDYINSDPPEPEVPCEDVASGLPDTDGECGVLEAHDWCGGYLQALEDVGIEPTIWDYIGCMNELQKWWD